MAAAHLVPFLIESFKIENILRPPFPSEIEATEKFIALKKLTVEDVVELALAYQKDAKLRDQKGMNVRVGDHHPPLGGPDIPKQLKKILARANDRFEMPWLVHLAYEDLHPLMDGNGRTGRAVWAWQMLRHRSGGEDALRLGFLHSWYYQTLGGNRLAP